MSDASLDPTQWSAPPIDQTAEVLEVTVGDILRLASERWPDAIGLTEGTGVSQARRWTFAEYRRDAESEAAGLLKIFAPGERVVVWGRSSPEWVLTEFAFAMAGIVLVTANPAATDAELGYVLRDSRAVGILAGVDNRGASLMDRARQEASSLPKIREVLDLRQPPRADLDGPLPLVSPDDIAQIQFTSGTTGRPKGAQLRHRGVANVSRFYALRTGVSGPGGWINPFPSFHTGGCVTGTLAPLWMGLNHVLMPSFDPALMLRLLEEEEVVAAIMVPTMAVMMLDRTDFATRDLSRLKHVGIGAAPTSPAQIAMLEQKFACTFANTYGQTEASPVITVTPADASARDKAMSVGTPLPQVELRVLGPDGHVLPVGSVGEICVRGYQVMAGYDGSQAEHTTSAIDSEGFLHTGDLGHVDPRGYLYIDGRLKDMIIRGGENIYPLEVELRLSEHERVASAVVVGRSDPVYGEVVEAVIVPKEDVDPPTQDELRAWCREVLQTYKVPTAWYLADQLPSLGSGKIPKRRVVEQRDDGVYRPLS